jgi:hypothetical protein
MMPPVTPEETPLSAEDQRVPNLLLHAVKQMNQPPQPTHELELPPSETSALDELLATENKLPNLRWS